jgi:hypothetical protein
MIRHIFAATLVLFSSAGLVHADNSCEAQAAEKKLAGAAKASFVKKCMKDSAGADCDKQAAEKKLAGAAKASFVKKCVKDAQGDAK